MINEKEFFTSKNGTSESVTLMTKSYLAQPTSLLHTTGFNKVYPSVLGQLILAKPLDIDRLTAAVQKLSLTIPQIFCRYEVSDNRFYPVTDNASDLIHLLKDDERVHDFKLDFLHNPQLAIFYKQVPQGYELSFLESHIFSDGAGFKEILATLVSYYNQPDGVVRLNHQDLNDVLNNLPREMPKVERSDSSSIELSLPFPEAVGPTYADAHQLVLSAEKFAALRIKARQLGFTVNDCLLTAYMRMLAHYNSDAPRIPLACPTDTRQFLPISKKSDLHIGNFTARYNPQPAVSFAESFVDSAKKVHDEMKLLKDNHQFLQSTLTLIENYEKYSLDELRENAKKNYQVRSISYTNMSIINDSQLNFAGNTLLDCFTAGAYRKAPLYQICFSTFKGRVNLVCNVIGDTAQHAFAQKLLQETLTELEEFAQN